MSSPTSGLQHEKISYGISKNLKVGINLCYTVGMHEDRSNIIIFVFIYTGLTVNMNVFEGK
jgi:hypothetical protein